MSPERHDVVGIHAIGMCTPVGLGAAATQTAVAAGITRFVETTVRSASGEVARASLVARLDPTISRDERLAFLTGIALRDCLHGAASRVDDPLPLFLSLPCTEGAGDGVGAVTASVVEAGLPGIRLEPRQVGVFAEGRAGFFEALQAARSYLMEGRSGWALVGATDSFCDQASLSQLVDAGRVLGEDNPDGLVPGEGSGFVLLGSADVGGPMLRLLACTLADEPNPFCQDEPNLATGLTCALRQIRESLPPEARVAHVYSGQSCESFWAEEFVRAYLRHADFFPEPLTVHLIADGLGDVGTSAGALLMGLASHRLHQLRQRGRNTGRAFLYGCSDLGRVGACVVELAS